MTGPARLDLLIPGSKPDGKGAQAQESFDQLLQRHARHNGPMEEMPRDRLWPRPEGQPHDEAHPAHARATVTGEAAPADARQEEYAPLVIDAGTSATRLERVYATHLVAGGYLSYQSPYVETEAASTPSGAAASTAPANASPAMFDLGRVRATGPLDIFGDAQTLQCGAGTVMSESLSEAGSVEAPLFDGRGIDDADLAAPPTWLAQMARLTVSQDGIATLWIRDFGGKADDIARRVAQLRARAVAEGWNVGTVIVNGNRWNHPHQGKESEA